MKESYRCLMMIIEGVRFAVPVSQVERIVRAVEVTAVPGAPLWVHGVMNLNGRLLPVVNLRNRFQLPQKQIDITDQFVVVRTDNRTIVLPVDFVSAIITVRQNNLLMTHDFMKNAGYITGVLRINEQGIVFLLSLDELITAEENMDLEELMLQMVSLSDNNQNDIQFLHRF